MIQALVNAFKIADLRKKLLFTFFIIAVYRLGAHIPTPGIDVTKLKPLFEQSALLGFLNVFTGGALEEFAVFALGIMPYITAAIIMELLTVVIPQVEELMKQGEEGRRKITQWTRYLTLFLCFTQAVAILSFVQGTLKISLPLANKVIIVVTLVTGGVVVMWLGELITQRGVGNGMSILIFISIISRFPQAILETIQVASPFFIGLVVLVVAFVFAAIIFIEEGQRRIPVSYAKRVVGRKVYGGASTYLPVKINSAGVIPIIFASSVLLFPASLARFFTSPFLQRISQLFDINQPLYLITYFLLIIFFTFFYSEIVFNPLRLADDLKKWGGFIPGVRPGRPTAEYINKVLSRVTFPGAVFLGLVALFPTILLAQTKVPFFKFFGGTSILITVGVALESVKQLEAQLLMRHYEGILK
jgi:preprotein translocase subunit SecY